MNIATDKRIKKVLVFDTETTPVYLPCEVKEVRGLSEPPRYNYLEGTIEEYVYNGKTYYKHKTNVEQKHLVFDIGWCVATKKGKILKKRSYLIEEVFTNMDLMKNAHYFNKYPDYLISLNNRKTSIKKWRDIVHIMQNDIEDFNINEVYAYNIAFDLQAVKNTQQFILNKEMLLWKMYELKTNCLWGMACETIFQQKGFKKIANEQGWLTPSGNYLTNAETCYKYLTSIYDFEEKHTALEDSVIEVSIMAKCFATHKKMSFGIINQPWRLVNIKENED